jgi:tyrosine-protein kinase Etk/Wzc
MNNQYPDSTNNNSRHILDLKSSKGTSKDMLYYYYIFLNKWYLLVASVIIAMIIFYFELRYTEKMYKIEGSVLIEDKTHENASKEVLVKELGFDKEDASMEDRMRILSSTNLMQRVVDSLNLNVTYMQVGHVRTSTYFNDSPIKLMYWNTEGVSKSFQLKFKHRDDSTFLFFKDEKGLKTELKTYGKPFNVNSRELVIKKNGHIFNSESPFIIDVQDEYTAAMNFAGRLHLEQVGRSSIISISIVDELPDRGISIINRLVREYSIAVMETKNDAGRRTLNFIDERLNYVTKELYDVEKQEEGFKTDKALPMQIPEITRAYIERSNAVDDRIMTLDIRADMVKSIESILSQPANYRSLPYTTEILNNAPLIDLIKKFNELISRRSQMMESAKEGNPILETHNEELAYLKNNILISVQAVKQEVADQKERYRQQIIPLENQINMMPANERLMASIMREKNIKETLFLFLLQKREETALSVAAQSSSSKLLERASLKGVVSPKPLQMGIFFLFMGLALPMLGLYVKDTFNNKIYHRSELDQYLNVPFVGFVPHVTGRKNKLIINESRSVLAESFRLLRSNLQHTALQTDRTRCVLVASTVSGEGKSFVAINLALTVALIGKKVALVGLDLRKPKLEEYLMGERTDIGITNVLQGQLKIQKVMRSFDRLPNLHFVDCGEIPTNPAELLLNDKVQGIFDYLRNNYDYIIIDGAPIGVVADSFLLKDHIDQTLVVLRYGFSIVSHLKFMEEVRINQKLPNMNVAFNDVKQERGNSYNYGYYSSYYYQEDQSMMHKVKKLFKPKAKNKKPSVPA